MRQHSTGSVGCLVPEFATFEYEDLTAAFVQFERDTEANDAATDNDCVPTFHARIVANGETDAKSVCDGSLGQRLHRRSTGSTAGSGGVDQLRGDYQPFGCRPDVVRRIAGDKSQLGMI